MKHTYVLLLALADLYLGACTNFTAAARLYGGFFIVKKIKKTWKQIPTTKRLVLTNDIDLRKISDMF